jgi:cold shock CspA family protein
VATTGTVVRFDRRRGYGFVAPDDGGEDVFVHQNNINMEGFRYLQVGEKVTYELEVGEKGMKAVSVTLLEPRVPRPPRPGHPEDDGAPPMDDRPPRDSYAPRDRDRDREPAPRSRPPRRTNDDAGPMLDKLRRKQERLISLLVEKGILAPGEIDGLDGALASVDKSSAGIDSPQP